MAGITIRGIDEALKRRLSIQAAQDSRSMEDEARAILRRGPVHRASPEALAGRGYTCSHRATERGRSGDRAPRAHARAGEFGAMIDLDTNAQMLKPTPERS
jgi:plasmid stability protein